MRVDKTQKEEEERPTAGQVRVLKGNRRIDWFWYDSPGALGRLSPSLSPDEYRHRRKSVSCYVLRYPF